MIHRANRISCECLVCGKGFEKLESRVIRGLGKYCSRACKDIGKRNSVTLACEHCHKSFVRPKSLAGKFCSPECYFASKAPVEHTCEQCGKYFTVQPHRELLGDVRFCSRQCNGAYINTLTSTTCEHCGKEYKVQKLKLDKGEAKYCSRQCFHKAKRGVNSPHWRGGFKYYRGKNWYEQRKLAYERDGGVCQRCHSKGNKVTKNDVHHIVPFRLFNGDYIRANDILNLITLCRHCHMKAEKGVFPVPKRLF